MTMASFAMTHIANTNDLRENEEVCDQINEALDKSLVTKEQFETMKNNLAEKTNTSKSDNITELIFLSLGQEERSHIELSIQKEYYCTKTYEEIFPEEPEEDRVEVA